MRVQLRIQRIKNPPRDAIKSCRLGKIRTPDGLFGRRAGNRPTCGNMEHALGPPNGHGRIKRDLKRHRCRGVEIFTTYPHKGNNGADLGPFGFSLGCEKSRKTESPAQARRGSGRLGQTRCHRITQEAVNGGRVPEAMWVIEKRNCSESTERQRQTIATYAENRTNLQR